MSSVNPVGAPAVLTMERDPTPAEAAATAVAKGKNPRQPRANQTQSAASAALKSQPSTPPEPILSATNLSLPVDSAELQEALVTLNAVRELVKRHLNSSKELPPKTAILEIAAKLNIPVPTATRTDAHQKMKQTAFQSLPDEVKPIALKNDTQGLLAAYLEGKVKLNPLLDYLIANELFDIFPKLLIKLGEKRMAIEDLQKVEISILDKAAMLPDIAKMKCLSSMLTLFKNKTSIFYNNFGKEEQGNRLQHLTQVEGKFVTLYNSSKESLENMDKFFADRIKTPTPASQVEAVAVKATKSPTSMVKACDDYDVETIRLKAERKVLRDMMFSTDLKMSGFLSEQALYTRTIKEDKKVTNLSFNSPEKTEQFNADLFMHHLAEYNEFIKSKYPESVLLPYVRYVDPNPEVLDNDAITKTLSECLKEFDPLALAMRTIRKASHSAETKDLKALTRSYETFIMVHNYFVSLIEPINLRVLAANSYIAKKNLQLKLTTAELERFSERSIDRSTGVIALEDKKVESLTSAAKEFVKLHEEALKLVSAKLNYNEECIQYLIDTAKNGGIDKRDGMLVAALSTPLDGVTKRLSKTNSAENWIG